MKFESTPRFEKDLKSLSKEHQKLFRELLPTFTAACDAYIAAQGAFVWPKPLRVNKLMSAKGIWEMTWSFASPDGRATFEFANTLEGVRLRWRRIGDHNVFREP